MAYKDHFQLADNMIAHLDSVIYNINDDLISSRYVGFVSVSAVTVYELAIKEIFMDFAEKKNKVFGNFVFNYFNRINGRIKYKVLWDEYVKRFGEKYVKRFKNKVQKANEASLRNEGISVLTSYQNIIIWRNQFTHEGIPPNTATYTEVVKAYHAGQRVIDCLAESMNR